MIVLNTFICPMYFIAVKINYISNVKKIKNTIKSNTTPTVLVQLCHKIPKQKYFYYVVIYGNLLSTYCLKHLFSISVSWHFVLLQFSDAKSPFDSSNDAKSILIQSEIIKRCVLCDILIYYKMELIIQFIRRLVQN